MEPNLNSRSLKMSEKHRNLPPWMVRSEAQGSADKEAEKRKHETTKRTTKKRQRRVVTYWMNERELVDTALGFLKDDDKTRAREAKRVPEEVVVMMIPETDEDTSGSDVPNISEQETVPYRNCEEESTSAKPPPDGPGASEKLKSDEEALKMVREIFFT